MPIEKAYSEKQVKSMILKTIIITTIICGVIMGFIIKNQPVKKEVVYESLISLNLEEPDFDKIATDEDYAFEMYTNADYQWIQAINANELILKKHTLNDVEVLLDYHNAILQKMPREGNEFLISELKEIDKTYTEYLKTVEEEIKDEEEYQEHLKKLKEELLKE